MIWFRVFLVVEDQGFEGRLLVLLCVLLFIIFGWQGMISCGTIKLKLYIIRCIGSRDQLMIRVYNIIPKKCSGRDNEWLRELALKSN